MATTTLATKTSAATPLEAEIRRRIALAGPMPVRQFMELCLNHPQYGYYTTNDPLGRDGDFITSPEISQVFGELLGLWAASAWHRMGQPENVRLVELGPGRGTMMLDALRAAQVVPAFRAAVVLHLVEISPVLQKRQQQAMATLDVPVMWHQSLEDVPDGPAIVLANELFDALPVNQAIKQFNGWYERMVEIDADGNLTFGIANEVIPLFDQLVPANMRDASIGSIYEWRADNLALALGRRLMRQGGVALAIDYGHVESAPGDTLQAVSGHAFVNPLQSPGAVDLTAHVDFQALALAAESMGAKVQGPIEQAKFLRNLGIEKRAAALRSASPEKAAAIDSAIKRLLGEGRTEMGMLFKVLGMSHPGLGPLPGFQAEQE
jgi:NADH dehydrogenase [ubiquinone] 1 alpha subcomplex assembly factor 7